MKYAVQLIVLSAFLMGCASFQSNAGKVLATTATTVDAAMKGWAAWVAQGQANAAQEAQVKSAYVKYQAAMAIAQNAYVQASTTGDQSAWQQASTILSANQGALLSLIQSFQTPTFTPMSPIKTP